MCWKNCNSWGQQDFRPLYCRFFLTLYLSISFNACHISCLVTAISILAERWHCIQLKHYTNCLVINFSIPIIDTYIIYKLKFSRKLRKVYSLVGSWINVTLQHKRRVKKGKSIGIWAELLVKHGDEEDFWQGWREIKKCSCTVEDMGC